MRIFKSSALSLPSCEGGDKGVVFLSGTPLNLPFSGETFGPPPLQGGETEEVAIVYYLTRTSPYKGEEIKSTAFMRMMRINNLLSIRMILSFAFN